MSYDFVLGSYASNYTYNVAPMFTEALHGYVQRSITELQGYKGTQLRPVLEHAIERMKIDPEKYKRMNPKNGWGSYEGALRQLEELRDACKGRANAILRIY